MSVRIALRCWTCGLTREVDVPAIPMFAYEVVAAAIGINWIGAFDTPRSRALVFCTDRCQRDAMTEGGRYRLRPPNSKPRVRRGRP